MKKLVDRTDHVVDDMVAGFLASHVATLEPVPGSSRAVRRRLLPADAVGVLIGGGSGHEPAFMGLVGEGLADAAAIGNVFASPGVDPILAAIHGIDRGRGVVQIFGNYAGDVMNFGLAAEMAADDGVRVETVLVTDDVASAPPAEGQRRRGIAGGLVVFKAAGAEAARGADLEGVVRVARKANGHTRSMGVALAPCVHPGTGQPSFTLDATDVEWGLGIHGEPGMRRGRLLRAADTVDELLGPVLEELTPGPGDRVALLVNGLGATTLMELYILAGDALARLHERRVETPVVWVGSFVTSMEMAGCSLSLTVLDGELQALLGAPASAPGFHIRG